MKKLQAKRYEIISEDDRNNFNSCEMLYADVVDKSSLFKTKIQLDFKNCNNQVIFSAPADSFIKELDKGFQDALQNAINKIPQSNPKPIIAEQQTSVVTENTPHVAIKEEKEQTAVFSWGNTELVKNNLNNRAFTLQNKQNPLYRIIFFLSSRPGIYHVKLNDGRSTIGYFEGNNLVYDVFQSDDEFRKVVLISK